MSNGHNPLRTDAQGFAGWKYNILGSNMSQEAQSDERDEDKER
jgi:hypothetical protein